MFYQESRFVKLVVLKDYYPEANFNSCMFNFCVDLAIEHMGASDKIYFF